MTVNQPARSSASSFFEIDDFRIDESLLTSDLSQSDDCSITMLAQISNAIPSDEHIRKELDTVKKTPHRSGDANGSLLLLALKSTASKKLPKSYDEHSSSVSRPVADSRVSMALLYYPAKKQRKNKRSKFGCWTCRLRHKACPEDHDPCGACRRLGLKCDWSTSRPSYMTDSKKGAARLKQIRNTTDRLRKRFCRVHQ